MAGVNRLLVGSPERSRGLLARRSRQNTALAPLPPPRMSSRQVATIWKISDTSNSPTNQCQRITADESLRLSTSRPCRRTSHHGTSRGGYDTMRRRVRASRTKTSAIHRAISHPTFSQKYRITARRYGQPIIAHGAFRRRTFTILKVFLFRQNKESETGGWDWERRSNYYYSYVVSKIRSKW